MKHFNQRQFFAANKSKFHRDNSMHDKLLEYYDIRRIKLQIPFRQIHARDNRMTWTLLGMSCCFIVFVFPIYLLNTFSLGGFVCCFPFKMISYLLNRSQIDWFSLFKIVKSSFYMSFPWVFLQMFVLVFSISGPQPHLNLSSICLILFRLHYFYLFLQAPDQT